MNDTDGLCVLIGKLADAGGVFSADDVREMRPDLNSKLLGAAFRRCHKAGRIELYGYLPSRTEGRNASLVRLWRGTK